MSHSHWEGQRGTGRRLLIIQRHREAFPISTLNLSLPLDPLSSRELLRNSSTSISRTRHTYSHHGRHERHSERCPRDQWDLPRQHEWRTSLPVSYRLIDGQPHHQRHLLAVILTVPSAIPERQLPVQPIPARGRLAFQCRQVQDHRVDAARSVIGNNGTLWTPTADSLAEGEQFANAYFDTETKIKMSVPVPTHTLTSP